eukprot:6915380-Prymnesium_polylepis.1
MRKQVPSYGAPTYTWTCVGRLGVAYAPARSAEVPVPRSAVAETRGDARVRWRMRNAATPRARDRRRGDALLTRCTWTKNTIRHSCWSAL